MENIFSILGRSYKTITEEAKSISGFQFVWFTDGIGWNSARYNLEETFNVKTRAARKGRDSFTKEAMDIPEKNVLVFKSNIKL